MKKDLKSIASYAKIMEVTTARIYQLIDSGDIVPEKVDTFTVIDLKKYPELPSKKVRGDN